MHNIVLKLGTVVTSDGDYVDIVAFDPESKLIESYDLKNKEVLIESIPDGQLKPFYNFVTKAWEEGATKEEIAEHEKALEEERRKREEEKKREDTRLSEIESLKKELDNTNATVAELMLLIPMAAGSEMEGGEE